MEQLSEAPRLLEDLIQALYASGYSRDILPPELKNAPFIAKPMAESELIDAARSTF